MHLHGSFSVFGAPTLLQAARCDFAYQFLLRVLSALLGQFSSSPLTLGEERTRYDPVRFARKRRNLLAFPHLACAKGLIPLSVPIDRHFWCFERFGRSLHRQLCDCGVWHFQVPSGKTSGQSGFQWNPQVKLAAMLSSMVPLVTHFDVRAVRSHHPWRSWTGDSASLSMGHGKDDTRALIAHVAVHWKRGPRHPPSTAPFELSQQPNKIVVVAGFSLA